MSRVALFAQELGGVGWCFCFFLTCKKRGAFLWVYFIIHLYPIFCGGGCWDQRMGSKVCLQRYFLSRDFWPLKGWSENEVLGWCHFFVDPGSVGRMLKHVITMYEVFFAPLMPLMLNFLVFCLFFSWGSSEGERERGPM